MSSNPSTSPFNLLIAIDARGDFTAIEVLFVGTEGVGGLDELSRSLEARDANLELQSPATVPAFSGMLVFKTPLLAGIGTPIRQIIRSLAMVHLASANKGCLHSL